MEETILKNKRICAACDSDTSDIAWNRRCESWHRHDGYWLCRKCWMRYVYSPIHHQKWGNIHNKKYNPRHMLFKGKSILLKENPRTGICSKCGRVGLTQIHHKRYHDDNPLKDTIELCPSCHLKETKKKYVVKWIKVTTV